MIEKFLGDVRGFFNIYTLVELVLSLLFIILGLIFFANPSMSKTATAIITGILIMVSGVASVYSYMRRKDIELFNLNMIYGIAILIIGLIACIFSSKLNIFLGIYLLILGVQRINYGILLKKFNEQSWLLTLVTGALVIVIAVITFFTSSENLVKVTGICTFGYGIINIAHMLLLRKRAKYFIEW